MDRFSLIGIVFRSDLDRSGPKNPHQEMVEKRSWWRFECKNYLYILGIIQFLGHDSWPMNLGTETWLPPYTLSVSRTPTHADKTLKSCDLPHSCLSQPGSKKNGADIRSSPWSKTRWIVDLKRPPVIFSNMIPERYCKVFLQNYVTKLRNNSWYVIN